MTQQLKGRIEFTDENRRLNRLGLKTQTRRYGEKQRHSVGDLVAHSEPTQILDDRGSTVRVRYLDEPLIEYWKPISKESRKRIDKRVDKFSPVNHRFMLMDFARHAVKIDAVRTQHLQEITDEDALAEGIQPWGELFVIGDGKGETIVAKTPREVYEKLWNSLHPEPGKRFENNPIVTVYRYEFAFLSEEN
jgi:hypothetical protein